MAIGQEVIRSQWPGTLPTVNAPQIRKTALPGQCITLAILANGDERDPFLAASTFDFDIGFNGKHRTYKGLHPAQIKRIKPEGGDFVMQVLGAAKVDVAENGGPPDLSMASLATFDFGWCVPQNAGNGKATIRGSAILPDGKSVRFDTTSLSISGFAAAGRADFKDSNELSEWMMSYYRNPDPARVLAACRFLASNKMAFAMNVRSFLAEVLRSSPAAAADLQARLAGETFAVRGYAIHLLGAAGYDTAAMIDRLPEKEQPLQREFQRRVPPLPDLYDLHVDPEHFDTPQRMDALWSIFLATGNAKPVRAIANLLMWRDDFKAYQAMRAQPGKSKPLTPAVGRGVCYMAAGWSLGSFVRNHGLVADFVDAWKRDPATPKVLREELETLLFNKAFKRS